MERLASCYFCGADAQLAEHAVVPESLDPDGGPTAVLCPTCQRKLDEVVELVLAAADGATRASGSPREPEPTAASAGEEPADLTSDETDAPTEEAATADDAELIEGPLGESDRRDPLDGVSVVAYNRVMRLLQNREFPVNRAEFEIVAQEAYGLGTPTVGAVLDSVIDRGLLVEEEGELFRPEDRPDDSATE